MTVHTVIVNISNTDENADWIKTDENRKGEAAAHRRTEAEYKKKHKKK